MKVLHLLYDHRDNPWVGGGGAVRAHELNRRLVEAGAEVLTLSGRFPGAPRERVEDGVRYRFIGRDRPYALSRWSYARKAGRALRDADCDVVVLDFSAYTPIPLPARPRVPIAGLVHHLAGVTARERWGPALGTLVDRLEARRLRRLRAISVVSRHTLDEVRKRASDATHIHVIGNGVDDALFSIQRREEDPPFILFLGRLDLFHKGLDVLIDAFGQLTPGHPATTLRIAGSGRDSDRVAARAARSHAAARIQLLGGVPTDLKHRLLAGARMLVVPSRMEGWGMVAAEAMAAGVPLITTSAGSLPELTGGSDHALIVPPGDVAALHAAIQTLDRDQARRYELSARGREEASKRFRWDDVAASHHEFLRDIAAGGP